MAEFPALPLFTDAYLGDTTHLSTIEHGAYLLLLIRAWRSPGSCLPDDDAKLAKIVGMTRSQWVRIAPTVREFFRAENGSLFQSRLTDEAVRVRQVRDQQAAAGRASALKRKGRHSTERIGERERSDKLSANQNATPTPSPTPTGIVEADASTRRARAKPMARPDDVPDDLWRDYCATRARQGAPPTETAIKGIRREAAKIGWTLAQAITECCERGWRGFKAEWINGSNRNSTNGDTRRNEGDGFTRALRRASAKFAADDDGGMPGDYGMG